MKMTVKAETISELLAWEPPRVSEIIGDGILWPGTKALMYGSFGTFKSMIAMHTGFCLTTNRRWFGHDVNRAPTMMLQLEIPKMLFKERVKKYLIGNKLLAPPDYWVITEPDLVLDRGYGIQAMDTLISTFKPKVVIIDPIYKIMAGDMNNNAEVKPVLDLFDRWIKLYNISIILVGHPRKPSKEELSDGLDYGGYELMGGSYWANWFDTMIKVNASAGSTVILEYKKVRNAQIEIPAQSIRINRDTLEFSVL
jgi:RecA-family ATPase